MKVGDVIEVRQSMGSWPLGPEDTWAEGRGLLVDLAARTNGLRVATVLINSVLTRWGLSSHFNFEVVA